MEREMKVYKNNCGQPDMERATIVKYHVEITGCEGESAFLEHVSDAEKRNDYFLHFIQEMSEEEINGKKILKGTLISWIDQDISDWLSEPLKLMSEYAAHSIENESVRIKVVHEEGWTVFDFDGSELINLRDCRECEAEEFYDRLYNHGEIIRVMD